MAKQVLPQFYGDPFSKISAAAAVSTDLIEALTGLEEN